MTKQCKQCGDIKGLEHFYKKRDTHESICKKCKSENAKNRYTHICEICGKEFKSRNKDAKFCSNQCIGESRKNQIEYKCDFCGKDCSCKKSKYDRQEHHYCSEKCMHAHQSILWKGEGSPLYKRIKTKCDFCGEEIELTQFDYDKYDKHYCNSECMGKHRSVLYCGENHPRWNENLTQEERENGRNYSDYINFIKEVLKRDDYTCQCCGEKGKGNNLNVHHLDGYNWCLEKRTYIDNGITLCEECHKKFHKEYGKGDNTKEQFEEFQNNL